MPVTQQDIADQVGVSRTLVAHALNGTHGSRISADTQRVICEAARRMKYQPRKLTTHNIGYVLPIASLKLQAEATFVTYIEGELRRHGYRLVLAELDERNPEALRDSLNAKTVDGVIFMGWHGGAVQNILSPEVPYVLSSSEDGIPPEVPRVTIDVEETFANLTRHLLELGHQHFGLVLRNSDNPSQRHVKQGVRDALRDAGLPTKNLQCLIASGQDAAMALRKPNPPTALIVAPPSHVLPEMYGLCRAGIRVPDDVSVASAYDNFDFGRIQPHLTATNVFSKELAQILVRQMQQKIQDPGCSLPQVRLAGDVIARASTAPPPRRG